MAVIVTAAGAGLEAQLDPRFGRAAYFLSVDPDTLDCQAQANPAVQAMGGAGSQAVQVIAAGKPEAVISGAFGPNAFEALRAAGIRMYRAPEGLTVRAAVEQYRAGGLAAVEAPRRGGGRRG